MNTPLNKEVEEILNLDAETSEMGKSFKLQQKADLYQLMLSLVNDSMPQGTYHVNTEVLLERLSEHFKGEEHNG